MVALEALRYRHLVSAIKHSNTGILIIRSLYFDLNRGYHNRVIRFKVPNNMKMFRSYVVPNTRITVWAIQYGHKLSVVRRVLVKVVVHLKRA